MSTLQADLVGTAGSRKSLDRHVVVRDPHLGEVSVRWSMGRPQPWRCRCCGSMTDADCAHTFAAALVLAETLLGLTRVPELNPIELPERTTA